MKRLAVVLIVPLLASLAALLGSCSHDSKKERPRALQTAASAESTAVVLDSAGRRKVDIRYEPGTVPWDLNGKPVTVGGLTFTPASQWVDHRAKGDKVAFYTYGPLENDSTVAYLAVQFFPLGKAQPYGKYFDYWLTLMDFSRLRDPKSAALCHDRFVDSMVVHVQSLYGSFTPASEYIREGEKLPRPNTRLVGIVVEAPRGTVVFELAGPDYTARVMIEAFINMIYRLRRVPAG